MGGGGPGNGESCFLCRLFVKRLFITHEDTTSVYFVLYATLGGCIFAMWWKCLDFLQTTNTSIKRF